MVHIALVVPSSSTQRIQEVHITIGHILCGALERRILSTPVCSEETARRHGDTAMKASH